MASSPEDRTRSKAGDPATEACWAAIREMDVKLMRGESFSGHERNCAYLNTAGGRWASVGFPSGFDFDDDARAVAPVDWDGDGDLDVWLANRTAPRVRFLRNDLPKTTNWLGFRLEATRGQRDAIGARVTVELVGRERQPLIREVRAGEGFLTQTTKRLHFGLGADAKIATLRVRWRTGVEESFTPPAPGAAYVLREGSGVAVPEKSRPQPIAALPTGAPVLPEQRFPEWVTLAAPVPVPPVTWKPLTGEPKRLDADSERPTLAILWSPEEVDAAGTLGAAAALRKAFPTVRRSAEPALDVIALADGEIEASRKLAEEAARATPTLALGFLNGTAMERLERLGRACFEMELPLKAPTAWLLDRRGQVLAWYRTVPDERRVRDDLAVLSRGADALLAAHLPFSGTWHKLPIAYQPLELAAYMLVQQEDAAAAADYLLRHRIAFRRSLRYAGQCRDAAAALPWADKDRAAHATAVDLLREALQYGPALPQACDALARRLLDGAPATTESLSDALAYAMKAVAASRREEAAYFLTQARAEKALGKSADAARTAAEALKLPATPQNEALRGELEKLRDGAGAEK